MRFVGLAVLALLAVSCSKSEEKDSKDLSVPTLLEVSFNLVKASQAVLDNCDIYFVGTGFDGKPFSLPCTQAPGTVSFSKENPELEEEVYKNPCTFGVSIIPHESVTGTAPYEVEFEYSVTCQCYNCEGTLLNSARFGGSSLTATYQESQALSLLVDLADCSDDLYSCEFVYGPYIGWRPVSSN